MRPARRGRSRTRSGSRRSTWCSGSCEEYGFDQLDAYQFLTQVSESPARERLRPELHVPREGAEAVPPAREAYGGTHAKLKEIAEEYRKTR